MKDLSRRDFFRHSGTAAAAAAVAGTIAGPARAGRAKVAAGEQLKMGFIGLGGRGSRLMRIALKSGLVNVAGLSDASQTSMKAAAADVEKVQGSAPQLYQDFRKLLENKDIQAVLIATPDHWHAITTILACQAGKDVYVEKPISHSIAEGLAMVKAVRDNKRICQVGLMQRNQKEFIEAIAKVHSGELGKIALVRCWYVNIRESIGNPPNAAPPAELDWSLWLGPAPEVPFNTARYKTVFPGQPDPYGSWRWFWDYAGGQLLDWGPHMLDTMRWGMKAKMPKSAQAGGGKFVFTDSRECPDTLQVIYEYDNFSVIWEHRQWTDKAPEPGRYHGVQFYGDKGTLFVDRAGSEVWPVGKSAPAGTRGEESNSDLEHIVNFVESCKSRQEPTMPIEEGFMTTAVCQLGNIAFRSGTKVVWDDEKKTIVNNPEAMKFFGREYRKGFELPKV
jgi:predicted dehydrogenase